MNALPRGDFLLLIFLGALVAACWIPAQGAEEASPSWPPASVQAGLNLLPENHRFFMYKGKPLVSITYVSTGGFPTIPRAYSQERLTEAARYGNHIYAAAHPTWVLADFPKLHQQLQDDRHWQEIRELARWCYEHDILLTLIFWSHKWNYAANAYQEAGCTDMFLNRDDPRLTEDLGKYGLPGRTRLDLHRLAAQKAVESTWEFPNVIYFPIWEQSHVVFHGKDRDGAFHRWWVEQFLTQGARQFPNSPRHLFSLEYGAEPPSKLRGIPDPENLQHPVHPSVRMSDFIYGECSDGLPAIPQQITAEAHALNVPLVRLAFSCGPRSGRPGPKSANEIRERLVYGMHPSGQFHEPIPQEVKDYFLQCRWYVENVKTWSDEAFSPTGGAGDEINAAKLPRYAPSRQPNLKNPPGYTNGVRSEGRMLSFACLYQDDDGDAPAQAEVWVDRDGDGRFHPDPDQGERLTMDAAEKTADSFRSGALYQATLKLKTIPNQPIRYVFRFADRHWYPPCVGGLAPGHYSDFTFRP